MSFLLPLSSESFDMFREEKCYVLHQLFAGEIKVSGHLQGGENLVQEALVHVHWDQAEEVGVKKREDFVPHRLLDLTWFQLMV